MFSSLNKAAGFRRFIHDQIFVQKAKTSQPKPVNYNFWFIGGYVKAHWWICGGSLVKMWMLIRGYEEAHWWRCGGSLIDMLWLIDGDVVAHWWICGGSLVEMRKIIA